MGKSEHEKMGNRKKERCVISKCKNGDNGKSKI